MSAPILPFIGILALSFAFAQVESDTVPIIGIVEAVSNNQITVKTGARPVVVLTNERTRVWKGQMSHDLSLVRAGDQFAGRCKADSSGRLVAELIELNVVSFFGVITKAGERGSSFEMFTNPNADPQSAYVKKYLKVLVDRDTAFDASAREDLKVGREVQLVGVDLRNGTTKATKVVVYEGGRPVRMPAAAKIVPPSGPKK